MTMAAVSGQCIFAWEQSSVTGSFSPSIPICLFVNIVLSMAALILSIQVSDRIADFKAYIAGDDGLQDLEQFGKQPFISRGYIIAGDIKTFVRFPPFLLSFSPYK